jgi:hypothetical protein
MHDCRLKHDPRVDRLGLKFGSKGPGVFILILEELGVHSETMAIKVDEVPGEASLEPLEGEEDLPTYALEGLARIVFESPESALPIIDMCAELGLFNKRLWKGHRVIDCSDLRKWTDPYTRRQQRKQIGPHDPDSEGSAQSRTKSDKVSLQDNTYTRHDKIQKNTDNQLELSTFRAQTVSDSKDQVVMDEPEFLSWSAEIKSTIARWNEKHRRSCGWEPNEKQLRKLAYGGKWRNRQRLCYESINVLGEDVTYAQVVLLAVKQMLAVSVRKRLANPFGWIWSALHGREGKAPWVHLPTAA